MAQPLSTSGEFMRLPYKNADVSLCQLGVQNMEKNRYSNILPPDQTIVNLTNGRYINANFIDVGREYKMIACQGPTSNTIYDFWSMVFEHRTQVILMVTPLTEKKDDILEEKCTKYWPDSGYLLHFKSFNPPITVYNVATHKIGDLGGISEILVSSSDVTHRVYHIEYRAWSDFGVIEPYDLYFIVCILVSLTIGPTPVVCHCSAGVGRTGTIAAIIRCLMTDEEPLSAILELRKQRHGMVQSRNQFRLIRDTLQLMRL